jgi:hypothetical protein
VGLYAAIILCDSARLGSAPCSHRLVLPSLCRVTNTNTSWCLRRHAIETYRFSVRCPFCVVSTCALHGTGRAQSPLLSHSACHADRLAKGKVVPVLPSLSIIQSRHMGHWTYSSTFLDLRTRRWGGPQSRPECCGEWEMLYCWESKPGPSIAARRYSLRHNAVIIGLHRPPLWSSGQSSWQRNGDVMCFL